MRHVKNPQRGDTLIEVLIAITVLGIVVAGVMAVMNRSLVGILNSAERTASRADINSETDLINYVYNNDKTIWGKIMDVAYPGNSDGSAPDVAKDICKINTSTPGSFYLKPVYDTSGGVSGVTFRDNLTATNGANQTQRAIIGKGLWVDAVSYPKTATNIRPYVDFYIKACWVPLGGSSVNSQSVTITRIYNYEVEGS
jgi:prepilin-type N-terminal cleavage/methylation domain-containing protein